MADKNFCNSAIPSLSSRWFLHFQWTAGVCAGRARKFRIENFDKFRSSLFPPVSTFFGGVSIVESSGSERVGRTLDSVHIGAFGDLGIAIRTRRSSLIPSKSSDAGDPVQTSNGRRRILCGSCQSEKERSAIENRCRAFRRKRDLDWSKGIPCFL